MKRGAIAFLDALGFKGIWRNKTPEQQEAIFDRLVDVKAAALQLVDPQQPGIVSVRAFSDTLLISVLEPDGDDEFERQYRALYTMTQVVSATIRCARMMRGPVINYRGAIAYGNFDIRDEYWMGEAVDEAAAAERLADAAIVWCCPSASAVLDRMRAALSERGDDEAMDRLWLVEENPCVVYDYDVPLKDGRSFRTHVINPYGHVKDPTSVEPEIIAAFGDTVDLNVRIKKQNTQRFLERARRWRK